MLSIFTNIFSILYFLLVAGTIVIILTDNQDSGRKVSWILVIGLLPVFGLICYGVFGFNWRRAGFFQKKHKNFLKMFSANADDQIKTLLFGHAVEEKIRPEYRELARLLARVDKITVSDDNEIEIITSGQRKFEALTEDLRNAKDHIHMEYFYFKKDDGSRKIKELLMQKAREGVKVRFIHENIANIDINPRYYNEMKKAGVEVVPFTSTRITHLTIGAQLNYRDHRKIVVIDGKIGYSGGMNISDDYFIRWRDTHMRITGEAVSSLQYSFLNSFVSSGGVIEKDLRRYFPEHIKVSPATLMQIVPDEPDNLWPVLQMGAVWAVQHTSKYIYIQTPYFVPPEPLLQALKSAALKGADVRIMIPEKADLSYMGPANRSFYGECLQAGIRIYEKTGNFIHSKTLVSDDYLSILGSANMDYRSFEINYEINTYIYDEKVARENRDIFLKDMQQCKEFTYSQWKKTKWYMRILQSIIRLFAPLL